MAGHPAHDRRLRILSRLSGGAQPGTNSPRLCDVAAEMTAVTGAGIMLMTGPVPGTPLCATDRVSALVEELQFTLGEGPCIDAFYEDRPVLEPDLVEPAGIRWTAFSGPAIDAGVRAIFGFPLQIGTVRLGALDLYCDKPGELTEHQHSYALSVAQVVAQAVLTLQADAPGGVLAPELDAASESRWVVHQASGMISAQLHIDIGDAFARLRAYAFANNQLVYEVATLVVDRSLRFDYFQDEE